MKDREEIIKNYVDSYNNFNVSKMIIDFSDEIVFENIQNAEITMTLNGLNEFKTQAELAKNIFPKGNKKSSLLATNVKSLKLR